MFLGDAFFMKRNNYVKINTDAILANYRAVCQKTGVPVMAVVKADAYGHGAACVAPVLQEAGVEYFAVSNIDEAVELRFAGIKGGILILGHTPECYAATADLRDSRRPWNGGERFCNNVLPFRPRPQSPVWACPGFR